MENGKKTCSSANSLNLEKFYFILENFRKKKHNICKSCIINIYYFK